MDEGAELDEHEAIQRVARVMREEASRLPSGSRVAACLEASAEYALRHLSGQRRDPAPHVPLEWTMRVDREGQ